MHTPQLCKVSDRSYTLALPFNVGQLRAHLEALGFVHYAPRTGDLYLHRWRSPDGASVISMFSSGRIVVLGPAVVHLEELTVSVPVEVRP